MEATCEYLGVPEALFAEHVSFSDTEKMQHQLDACHERLMGMYYGRDNVVKSGFDPEEALRCLGVILEYAVVTKIFMPQRARHER